MSSEEDTPAGPWDVVAEAWEIFEQHGLNPAHLELLPHLEGPVLVVGAGQGLLVEALSRRELKAIGVDWSRRMVQRAAERRPDATMVRGSAMDLPFAGDAFGSIILATGILDEAHAQRTMAVLAEARRVLKPRAYLVVAMFLLDEQKRLDDAQFGIDQSPVGLLRAVELWSLGESRDAWAEAIAGWTGVSLETAREREVILRTRLESLLPFFDRAAAIFRARGFDPRESLLRCAVPLGGGACDERAIATYVKEAGFTQRWRHERDRIVVIAAERVTVSPGCR